MGYAGEYAKKVLPVGFAPTTRRFEAGRSDLLSYGSLLKWCAGTVLPRLPPQCRCGDLLIDLPARECRVLCAAMSGGPGRIRTINLPIQSRALR